MNLVSFQRGRSGVIEDGLELHAVSALQIHGRVIIGRIVHLVVLSLAAGSIDQRLLINIDGGAGLHI